VIGRPVVGCANVNAWACKAIDPDIAMFDPYFRSPTMGHPRDDN
jgi:hypothetical protein